MRDLILIAASGLAREVLAILRTSRDYRVAGILDDDPALLGMSVAAVPVIGPIGDACLYPSARFVICVGAGDGRRRIFDRLALAGITPDRYGRILDPSVRVPSGCTVGLGSILLSHVVLTADVSIGAHVVAMPHVTFTHDDVADDFATLAAGVVLGGGVRVGKAAYVGMSSCVRQGVSIGSGATLGMGATLLRNLPAGETWAGVPAAPIRQSADKPDLKNGSISR